MVKRLVKSRYDRKISGVCGGLGEYFNVDATAVRVLFILAAIFTAIFPMLVAYILMAFIIPES